MEPRATYRCLGPRNQNLLGVLERIETFMEPDGWTPVARLSGREVDELMRSRGVVVVAAQVHLDGLTDTPTDEVISTLFALGERVAASTLNKFARDGCGYDLGEVLRAAPADGKDRSEPCPGCGRDFEFRRPAPA